MTLKVTKSQICNGDTYVYQKIYVMRSMYIVHGKFHTFSKNVQAKLFECENFHTFLPCHECFMMHDQVLKKSI